MKRAGGRDAGRSRGRMHKAGDRSPRTQGQSGCLLIVAAVAAVGTIAAVVINHAV